MTASDEIQQIANELVLVSASHFERLSRLAREVAVLEWAMDQSGPRPISEIVAPIVARATDGINRIGSIEQP